MDQDYENHIRARAYSIWEAAGRPDGEHESHWHQAMKELGLVSPVEQKPGTTTDEQPGQETRQARM